MTEQPLEDRLRIGMHDRLRKAREDFTDLNKEQFADAIGVSRNTVANYEKVSYTAQRQPVILNAWALRTGVPIEWLRTGNLPEPPDGGQECPREDSNLRHSVYNSVHSLYAVA